MVKLLILGQDSPKAKVLTISGELEAYSFKIPDAALLICRAADYYLFGRGVKTTKEMIDSTVIDRAVKFICQ